MTTIQKLKPMLSAFTVMNILNWVSIAHIKAEAIHPAEVAAIEVIPPSTLPAVTKVNTAQEAPIIIEKSITRANRKISFPTLSSFELTTEVRSTFSKTQGLLGQPGAKGEKPGPRPLTFSMGFSTKLSKRIDLGLAQKLSLAFPSFYSKGVSFTPNEPKLFMRLFRPFGGTANYGIEPYLKISVARSKYTAGQPIDLGLRGRWEHEFEGSRFGFTFNFEAEVNGTPVVKTSEEFLTFGINPEFSFKFLPSLNSIHGFNLAFASNASGPYLQTRLSPSAMPHIQNGLEWSPVKGLTITSIINNYAYVLPTINNTWVNFNVKYALAQKNFM